MKERIGEQERNSNDSNGAMLGGNMNNSLLYHKFKCPNFCAVTVS